MPVNNIDFEGADITTGAINNNTNPDASDNKDDVTHLNGSDVDDITNSEQDTVDTVSEEEVDSNKNEESTNSLTVGDQIEYNGNTYTIVDNGDLVDEKGNVFKEASSVQQWLEENDIVENEESTFDIAELQKEVGVEIKDENGNAVEFENTSNGVKQYVNSVIDLKSKEIQEATINRFYSNNPLVKQFVDYVNLTGTARGFGDIPDRSGITIDEGNEAQQIAVIKMAANEFGNKTINDNYIDWLRESGNLYSYAKEQLSALIDKDKQVRKNIEEQANIKQKEELEQLNEYWNKVKGVINSRVIGGYKIPENFTRNINGKNVICNSNDFFNYISNACYEDENGNRMTGYTKSLNELTDEEYLNRELLDAWLMFTGGSYKDLVDMAIKENEVRKLVVKSKQSRSAKTVKVVKKQSGKADINDIIL